MIVTPVNTMNYELRTMNYFIQNKAEQTQFQTKRSRGGRKGISGLRKMSRPLPLREGQMLHLTVSAESINMPKIFGGDLRRVSYGRK